MEVVSKEFPEAGMLLLSGLPAAFTAVGMVLGASALERNEFIKGFCALQRGRAHTTPGDSVQ